MQDQVESPEQQELRRWSSSIPELPREPPDITGFLIHVLVIGGFGYLAVATLFAAGMNVAMMLR